jgi:hypothetical protein
MRLTWLADELRAAGLRVNEVPGWQTRGSATFTPRVSLRHHTVTPASWTDAAVIRLLRDGRRDLPGPLCQVGLGRDGTCHIIAAGRANHAGYGRWAGIGTGNTVAFGVESFNNGREPFTFAQIEAWDVLDATVLAKLGRPADNLCSHAEWALPTGRKTDVLETYCAMAPARARVAALLDPTLIVLEAEMLLIRAAKDGAVWLRDAGQSIRIATGEGFTSLLNSGIPYANKMDEDTLLRLGAKR